MKTLRKYQQDVKTRIYQEWNDGNKNVLGVMPTGAGKAFLLCNIAMDFAVLRQDIWPTAIIVHRKELVQQLSLTLAEEGVTHNIIAPRNVILGIVAAQRSEFKKQFYDYMAPVTVISVDTLLARISKHQKWAESIKLWIVDEAAHLLADNKWGRATKLFPGAIGLGVTATPERLDGKGLGGHVDGVFDTMVEGPTVKWMIANGFLSKYKIAVPGSDYQNFLKKAGSGSDFSKAAMSSASQESSITGDVVKEYLRHAKGKQAILFATDIRTCEEMTKNFIEAGVKAAYLTGLSSNKERFDGMVAFREKRIQVLLNVDLFDEGLDVPGIECVSMARPTMSYSKFRQMVGRGLRPAPDKDHMILIDHVGNVTRHGLPCSVATWTLDRRVRKRKEVNMVKICGNPMCSSPYDRLLKSCPWCGFEPEVGMGGGRIPPVQVDGDLYLIDPETLQEMEDATELESPNDVGERVAAVAGHPAGMRAKRNQEERLNVQSDLAEVVAMWAGEQRDRDLEDYQIHKLFYIEQGKTINQALAEPKKDMIKTIEALGGKRENYTDRK